jgi:phage tail-like protein
VSARVISGWESAKLAGLSDSSEPLPSCRFYVEIDGRMEALFTEVSGLQVEVTVQEYEEGGNNSFVHRLPGRAKVGNITLKRGMTRSNEFLKWLIEVASGTITRRNISVVMYDTGRGATLRWNFTNAYPVKWTGPQFSATSTAAAVETLELAHERIDLDRSGLRGDQR